MNFLVNLLTPIIRPIIQQELGKLREWFTGELEKLKQEALDSRARLDTFRKYDNEAHELMDAMARSNTSEERWAILQRIRNARPML